MQQMQVNQSERMQSSGDNSYHCTKHTQTSKGNKTKPNKQGNYKKSSFFIWYMIENHHRQVPTIVQVRVEAVS